MMHILDSGGRGYVYVTRTFPAMQYMVRNNIMRLVKFSQGKNGVKHVAMFLTIAKEKATVIIYELPICMTIQKLP